MYVTRNKTNDKNDDAKVINSENKKIKSLSWKERFVEESLSQRKFGHDFCRGIVFSLKQNFVWEIYWIRFSWYNKK